MCPVCGLLQHINDGARSKPHQIYYDFFKKKALCYFLVLEAPFDAVYESRVE